jgi:hypothetical protein
MAVDGKSTQRPGYTLGSHADCPNWAPWHPNPNEPCVYKDVLACLQLAKEKFPEIKSVVYPASSTDVTPSKVFDNVTFIDIDENAIATLMKAGFNAIERNLRTFRPPVHYDLLLRIACPIEIDVGAYLRPGGYLIANNWFSAAEKLNMDNGLQLIGAIDYENGGNAIITTDTSKMFSIYDSWDELKERDPELFERYLRTAKFLATGLREDDLRGHHTVSLEEIQKYLGKPFKEQHFLYLFQKV